MEKTVLSIGEPEFLLAQFILDIVIREDINAMREVRKASIPANTAGNHLAVSLP
ncbi:hypothetical protein [Alistipes sp. An66]|uniref:hypothetical protein n=1 Tax=Alistipes sp. An66 TaxID=1965650 RepID=UPI001EF458D4|nr:hypothetical protein [Alistipes sp. An66]